MILMIDNYDSFTWNLVQYLGELGADVSVRRNDEIDLDQVSMFNPTAIVISPGPGKPSQAGMSVDVISECSPSVPILGVCLGHQSIAVAFGGTITRAKSIMHGKVSSISHDGKGIFQGLPNPFEATRYHSLIVERDTLPNSLSVSAWTSDGEIMGIRHKKYNVEGVQFHPESILTGSGKDILNNFLQSFSK